MTALHELKATFGLDWPTLAVGLRRGWCSAGDVSAYADGEVAQSLATISPDLAELATSEQISIEELTKTIERHMRDRGELWTQDIEFLASEKWRFAHIRDLLARNISNSKKVDELQGIYAEFGFPPDMASCSIYAADGVDPLLAAVVAIDKLEKKLRVV